MEIFKKIWSNFYVSVIFGYFLTQILTNMYLINFIWKNSNVHKFY